MYVTIRTIVSEYSEDKIQKLRESFRPVLNKNCFLTLEGFSVFSDKLRALRPSDPTLRSAYDVLANYFIRADYIAPYGGELAVKYFVENIDLNLLKYSDVSQVNETVCFNLLNSYFTEKEIKIVKNSIELMGSSARIRYEKSRLNADVLLEIKQGYCFTLNSAISIGRWSRKDCKVMCIDGIVESVSEISHLLNFFSSSKFPLLLFCRGFSNDVLNTLAVNYKRGSLDILPIAAPVDFDTANIMLDFSTVCGSEVLSSDKGQLISHSKPENLSSIDFVDFDNQKLVVVNSSTSKAVEILKKNISKKIETVDPSLIELNSKRLHSLDAAYGILKYPDNSLYSNWNERIDLALKMFSHSLIHGTCTEKSSGVVLPASSFRTALQTQVLIKKFCDSCQFAVLLT